MKAATVHRPVATAISTGLAGLDAQVSGGVPPGCCLLLLGEPMNAVELFAYHFAAVGPTEFLATSLTPEDVAEGVAMVGGKPDTVEVSAYKGNKLPSFSEGRAVVYTLSEVIDEAGWDTAYAWLAATRQEVRRRGAVLLVVATPGLHSDREVTRLKLWADGVMELGFDRQGFGLYPYLKVTKLRRVPDSSRFLLFKETDRGLFMESTRRVF